MTLHVEGTNFDLAGQWKHKVEETWEGGRRREIPTSVPIAQQYLLANSPVTDLITPPAVVPPAARAAAAAAAPRQQPAVPVPRHLGGGRAGGPGGRGGGLPVLEVAMGVIVGENKFNQPLITARPGQPVAIAFNNNDDMPHNIVVFKRGDMAAYEKELIAMLSDPTAQGRGLRAGLAQPDRRDAAAQSAPGRDAEPRRADRTGRLSLRVLVPRTLGDDAGHLARAVVAPRVRRVPWVRRVHGCDGYPGTAGNGVRRVRQGTRARPGACRGVPSVAAGRLPVLQSAVALRWAGPVVPASPQARYGRVVVAGLSDPPLLTSGAGVFDASVSRFHGRPDLRAVSD